MKVATNKRGILYMVAVLSLLASTLAPAGSTVGAFASRTFPETGKTVNDPFLSYWDENGGLAQQGYPITNETNEKNDADGKTYKTQYFERARFEHHPENAGTKFEVLLGLLGKEALTAKYGNKPPSAPKQVVPGEGSRLFSETGKTVTGLFLDYWEENGGLAQQGFPITEAYNEKNDADGKTYITQYFERARFEYHPENADPKYKVLLGLVGKEINSRKQGTGGTGTGGAPPPNTPAGLNVPGWTHITVTTNNIVIFYDSNTGVTYTARLGTDGSLTLLFQYLPESISLPALEKGFTTVQAGPNNRVLFYNASTGKAELSSVQDNGQIGGTLLLTFSAGLTITIDPISGIVFGRNTDNGKIRIDKLDDNGVFTSLQEIDVRPGNELDALVTPLGLGGLWYAYVPESGQVSAFAISDQGVISLFGVPSNVGAGMTHIVPNYANYVVFYSKGEGLFKSAKISLRGEPIQIASAARAEKEWSIVAPTQSPIMICYDDKGNIQTYMVVPENGVIAPLKLYEAGK